MKQENTQKSKLWLWLVLGVVLLAVVGTVLAFVLGGSGAPTGGKTDRAALYWNIDRQVYLEGSETGLTTRRPGEDGTYKVRFAYDGVIKEFIVADRKLVNKIDMQDVMGLVFDADGVVIDIVDAEELAVRIGKVNFVRSVDGNVVKVNSSIAMNGMEFELEITDKTQIYDVRQGIENPGKIIDASELKTFANVYVFTNEEEEVTHIYLIAFEDDMQIYWRAEQKWDAANKKTAREPDGDGYYSIEFCCNGEMVILRTRDEAVVNSIDNKTRFGPHFCFDFDEKGNITQILSSAAGTFGILTFERGVVKSVENGMITAKTEITGDDGSSYSITLPEGCPIYDGSHIARRDGVQGQAVDSVRPGDIITVWSDTDGVPVLCYISYRIVDVPSFYNLVRYYDATNNVSTREPNEKGWYEFEMVKTGSVGKVIVKTKDKNLVDYIDAQSGRLVALRLDGDKILQVYESTSVYTLGIIGAGSVVNEYNGVMASVMAWGKPEGAISFILSGDCKFYDVSGVGKWGEETEMRLGDIIYAHRQPSGEVVAVYITRRTVGSDKLYYNLDYKYDSVNKVSTREPDEDGYYVFNLINQGKKVTVKTKDKALVDQMDAPSDLTMALDVKNGIARAYYDSAWTHSLKYYSGYRVKKINGDGTVLLGDSIGTERTITLGENCVVWNVSHDYDSHMGEKTKLRVGDMIVSFADMYTKVQEILVRRRYLDDLGWKLERLYDGTTGQTLRTPDADGYYYFEMAINGKIRTVKTKNKELANRVESQTGPMAMRLSGDVIKSVVDVAWMRDTKSLVWTEWDITNIKKSEVTAEFTKPGYATTGDTGTYKLASNAKIYDFSPTAKQFGEKTTLKVGDRVRAQTNNEGELLYVMVLSRDTRTNGSVGYCSHCDKEVRWQPWTGTAWDGVDCHYYLVSDLNLNKQTNVGNTNIDYEVVLDLDGKSLTVEGARAFLVWRGDTLTIIDSVGGGEVKATGTVGGNGGTMLVTAESTVNLLGGTYSFIPSDIGVTRGAVAYVTANAVLNIDGATLNGGGLVGGDFAIGGNIALASSVCNLYSGTITNGSVTAANEYTTGANQYTQGGNIHVGAGSTFNMYGGVVSNGLAKRTPGQAAQGGNIYSLNGQVNIYGGKVIDGNSQQHGGNIFLSTANLLVKDAVISGGTARDGYATGVYCQFTCDIELQNSTLEGSVHFHKDSTIKVTDSTVDGSININNEDASLIMDNATMTGDLQILKAATVVASGKTTVAMGQSTGITLGDVLMDVSGLTDGAKLVVDKDGVFTTELTNPAAYTGYFESVKPFTSAQVKGNALAIENDASQLNKLHEVAEKMTADGVFAAGGTVTAECPYCGESVQWEPLQEARARVYLDGDKHYYLASDFTSNSEFYYVRGTTCLHLNGHNITSSARAFYTDPGATLTIMGEGTVIGNANTETRGGPLDMGGALNLFGGTYHETVRKNILSARGNTADAVINIYDGATIESTSNGPCVYITGDSRVNVYGGVIRNGYRNGKGGNIRLDGSTAGQTAELYIYGGTITNGNASEAGGNIYAFGPKAVVEISGGTITNGGVLVADDVASFTLTGEPVISELDLTSGIKPSLGTFTGNADIKVNATGVFTNELEDPEAYLPYFGAADVNCQIEIQGKTLAVAQKTGRDLNAIHTLAEKMTADGVFNAGGTVTAKCPYCDADVQWEPLPTATGRLPLAEAKHYYLDKDLLTNADFYNIQANICLHLNGHNITSAGRLFYNQTATTLNIMGSGQVVGKPSNTTNGAVDIAGGVLNLFGGAYTSTSGNAVVARGDSVINLYEGASITASTGNDAGYAVNVTLEGTFNLHGGEVTGDINVSGTEVAVNIHGGKVTGSILTGENVANIQVSGAPEIGCLDLTSGTKLILGDLKPEAKITVLAGGAFTVANDKAADYDGCFLPASDRYTIELRNNVFYSVVEADPSGPLVDGSTLKILAITSSHGRNTTDLLYEVATAEGATDVTVARLFKSACTLETHWNCIQNMDPVYQYTKKSTSNNGQWTQQDNQPILTGLLDEEWDIIFIQQSAAESPISSTYQPYMDDVLNFVKSYAPNARIVWNMTWAYESSSTESVFVDTFGGNQMAMYEGIVNAMQQNVMTRDDIAALLPTGTAVQNLRTSYIGDTLTTDTVHLNDLAKVLAGYTVYSTLLGRDLTDIKLEGFTSTFSENWVQLTNREQQVILESVNAARNNPFEVTQSAYTDASFAVISQEAAQMSFTTGTVTARCPYCGVDVQWEPLPEITDRTYLPDAKHYYLEKDLSNSSYYYVQANICLHLNGKSITSTTRVFFVDKPVVIMGNGNVTGKGVANDICSRGVLDVMERLYLFGGTYKTLDSNPVISIRSSIANNFVNMYDGVTITRDTAGTNVAIYDNGKLNMYGGTISGGNTTGNGGNIWIKETDTSNIHKRAALNLYGGTIENGTAAKGGNVYATGPRTIINLAGGKVLGGSVYAEADVTNVLLSGAPEVSCLDLTSGAKATIGQLEADARIAVLANGIFTTENENAANYEGCFTSHDPNSVVERQNNVFVCQSGINSVYTKAVKMTADGVFNAGGTITAKCPYCDADVQWEPLPAATGRLPLAEAKHYYLDRDLTANADFYNIQANICLHLNGHNITSAARLFYNQTATTLNIMGDGQIVGKATNTTNGAVDIAGGVLNLFGGAYTSTSGNAVVARGDSVINLYEGASITACTGNNAGYAVNVNLMGTFNLHGGVVTGDINVSGTEVAVNFYGGKVVGSVLIGENVADIQISGTPEIGRLDLTSGTKLALGNLTTGAEIKVVATDGVISTTHPSAANYTAFIKAATAGKQVTAVDNALVMGNA